tara:strand:- start:536 stop:760 length:225 start_codon:yes stop_codon:yes gene_type:complete
MQNEKNEKVMRDIVSVAIENGGADAVVIAWSSVTKNVTHTFISAYGNRHACEGLAGELYDRIVVESEEDEEAGD